MLHPDPHDAHYRCISICPVRLLSGWEYCIFGFAHIYFNRRKKNGHRAKILGSSHWPLDRKTLVKPNDLNTDFSEREIFLSLSLYIYIYIYIHFSPSLFLSLSLMFLSRSICIEVGNHNIFFTLFGHLLSHRNILWYISVNASWVSHETSSGGEAHVRCSGNL